MKQTYEIIENGRLRFVQSGTLSRSILVNSGNCIILNNNYSVVFSGSYDSYNINNCTFVAIDSPNKFSENDMILMELQQHNSVRCAYLINANNEFIDLTKYLVNEFMFFNKLDFCNVYGENNTIQLYLVNKKNLKKYKNISFIIADKPMSEKDIRSKIFIFKMILSEMMIKVRKITKSNIIMVSIDNYLKKSGPICQSLTKVFTYEQLKA